MLATVQIIRLLSKRNPFWWTEAMLSVRTIAASKNVLWTRCHIRDQKTNIKLKWNKNNDEKEEEEIKEKYKKKCSSSQLNCNKIYSNWATGHYLWCYVFAFEHQVSNIYSMAARYFFSLLLFSLSHQKLTYFLTVFPLCNSYEAK